MNEKIFFTDRQPYLGYAVLPPYFFSACDSQADADRKVKSIEKNEKPVPPDAERLVLRSHARETGSNGQFLELTIQHLLHVNSSSTIYDNKIFI